MAGISGLPSKDNLMSLTIEDLKSVHSDVRQRLQHSVSEMSTTLNAILERRSYVGGGCKPTQEDVEAFLTCPTVIDDTQFPHLYRWHTHIASFTPEQRQKWILNPITENDNKLMKKAEDHWSSRNKMTVLKRWRAFTQAQTQKSKTNKPKDDDDADDDGNPFKELTDEEESEEERKKEEMIAAKAEKLMVERLAAGKKREVGRSTLILDVKPLGSATDMKELEQKVRKIEMEGLRWAGSELVVIAYGLRKLRIISVIVDDLVSTDVLREKIEALEDLVQSTDIFAFNKV